jgi:hypothetical protein
MTSIGAGVTLAGGEARGRGEPNRTRELGQSVLSCMNGS